MESTVSVSSFNATPSTRDTSALFAAYSDWLTTRQALLSTRAMFAARGLPVAQASVVLENALMHTLLHDEVAQPAALWPRVDAAALAVGLACAHIDAPALATPLAEGIRETLRDPIRPSALPAPTASATAFAIGGFSLHRNSWVDTGTMRRRNWACGPPRPYWRPPCYAACWRAPGTSAHPCGSTTHSTTGVFDTKACPPSTPACSDVLAPASSAPVETSTHRLPSAAATRPATDDGAWCLDPPFLDATIARVEARIHQWRRDYGTTMLLIIPAAYTLRHRPDETVVLEKGVHVYEGLAGTEHPLPVDVAIHRYGLLPGFNAHSIWSGYLPHGT